MEYDAPRLPLFFCDSVIKSLQKKSLIVKATSDSTFTTVVNVQEKAYAQIGEDTQCLDASHPSTWPFKSILLVLLSTIPIGHGSQRTSDALSSGGQCRNSLVGQDLTHSQDGDDDHHDPQLMVVEQAARSDTVKKVCSNHNAIRNDWWWMKRSPPTTTTTTYQHAFAMARNLSGRTSEVVALSRIMGPQWWNGHCRQDFQRRRLRL